MAFALIIDTIKASADAANVTTDAKDTTGANLIVLSLGSYAGSLRPTISDSKSNTWTALTDYTDTGVAIRQTIFYCLNPTVGSGHTFTANSATAYPTLGMSAWSGADSYDSQENGAHTTTVQVLSTGSVTPSANGALLVTGLAFYALNGTRAIDNGFTILGSVDYSVGFSDGGGHAYKIQGTAAAINPQWDAGAQESSMAVSIAVFKASAGAAPAAVKRRRDNIYYR